MKKYYRFSDLIVVLWEEYKKCADIISKLNKCIRIDSYYSNYSFKGSLAIPDGKDLDIHYDRNLILNVKKKYLKLINSAFVVSKKDGKYELVYDYYLNNHLESRKYIPKVEIIDEENFYELVTEFFNTDLMNTNSMILKYNYDCIFFDFNSVSDLSMINKSTNINYDSRNNNISYNSRYFMTYDLFESIFSMKIPSDIIPDDLLKLIEKNEDKISDEFGFLVDGDYFGRKGILEFEDKNDIIYSNLKRVKKREN